jgi:hypothetical protein
LISCSQMAPEGGCGADVGRQGAMKPDDRAFGRNGMDGYIVGELDWSRVTALVEVDFAERRRREGDPARGKWAIVCQEQEQADGDACRKNNQGGGFCILPPCDRN